MATLLRTATRFARINVKKQSPSHGYCQPRCCISTSKKNKDSLTTRIDSPTALEETEEFKKLKEHFADYDPAKPKNWVSFGFSYTDREEDTFLKNITMFSYISFCIVVGFTYWAYLPDFRLKHWAQREGFLELERREREGLPLVDKNLIPPELVELPSEEEIGDMDIII